MKITHILPFIFILIIGNACTNNTEEKLKPANYCGTQNPLDDLDWLKEIKTTMEMTANAIGGQIIAWKYKGETVFWVDDCYSCDDKLIFIYDCSGTKICEFGGIGGWDTCGDFQVNASDSTMLFNHVAQ
ncbi:MAG TPA: hypothetical protein P5514_08440 [Bacteroidales bacterium]|nr:hypothetical protein [Bacteroidales bacterium]HPE55858.1 hypothetical protein [Bacteroidales bacterium]HRX96958.1 hypothetical protein [Bacteroidales bacterium]